MQNINEDSVKLNYFNIVFSKELKGNSLKEATQYFTEWEKNFIKYDTFHEFCILTGKKTRFRIVMYKEFTCEMLDHTELLEFVYNLETTIPIEHWSIFKSIYKTDFKEVNDEILNTFKAHIKYEIIEYNGKWFAVCLEFVDLDNLKLYKIEDLAFAFKIKQDEIKLEEIKKENEIKEKQLIEDKKIEEVETKTKLEAHIKELELEYERVTKNLTGRQLKEFFTTVLDNKRTKLKEYIMACYLELYFTNKGGK